MSCSSLSKSLRRMYDRPRKFTIQRRFRDVDIVRVIKAAGGGVQINMKRLKEVRPQIHQVFVDLGKL